MIAKAIVISVGESSHRVLFQQDRIQTDSDGNKTIAQVPAHREIPSPIRDAAVNAAKSVGCDLSREPYATTGAVPVKGSVVIVGVFGAPPALPSKGK